MKETQVLFRIERATLDELDRSISKHGFRTRNEWFRAQIRKFVEESRRQDLARKLEKLSVDDVSENDIIEMVREWRGKKRSSPRSSSIRT